jgi:hypothetical protein
MTPIVNLRAPRWHGCPMGDAKTWHLHSYRYHDQIGYQTACATLTLRPGEMQWQSSKGESHAQLTIFSISLDLRYRRFVRAKR